MKKLLSRPKVITALVWFLLVVGLVAAFALAWSLSAACHRWLAPIVTGTTDPVANAIFCRAGR